MGLLGFGKKTCGLCNRTYRGKTYQGKGVSFCPACYQGICMRIEGKEWKEMDAGQLKEVLSQGLFSATPILRTNKPQACMICGGKLSMWPWEVKDGFLCDSCYEKAARCLRGKAEDLTIEEIQEGLALYEKRKEQTLCAYCQGKIDGETDMALGDNQLICGSCIQKVRLVCPVKVTYETGETQDYGIFHPNPQTGRKVAYDPLEEMDLSQYRQLRSQADARREELRQKLPSATLIFEVEDISRWSPQIQYHERKNKKETVYQVLGRVLMGSLQAGEVLKVKRGEEIRELKPFMVLPYDGALRSDFKAAPLDRLQLDGKSVIRQEGEEAMLLFKQEPSFLYPGDLLWRA